MRAVNESAVLPQNLKGMPYTHTFIDRWIDEPFSGIKPRTRMIWFTRNLLLIYFDRSNHASRSEDPHLQLRGNFQGKSPRHNPYPYYIQQDIVAFSHKKKALL